MRESKRLFSLAIGGLAVVNVALGIAIFSRWAEPQAMAQVGGRADLMAVSAHYVQNTGAGLVVVMDDRTGVLAVIQPDIAMKVPRLLGQRDVSKDLQRVR